MKKIILLLTFVFLGFVWASAQEAGVRHEIALSGGVFLESGTDAQSPGVALRFRYGVDIPLENGWSVMPGAGVRTQFADIRHVNNQLDGYPNQDYLYYADVFCQIRYQISGINIPVVFGLGPIMSVALTKTKLGITPDGPSGLDKYHMLDLGLYPNLSFYLGGHWLVGLEAIVGLRNMRVHHDDNDKSSTFMNMAGISIGYRF
jgi:hypothetical protein